MKVILTTNIKKLGKIGDLVNVRDGFARNFLFPNNMALRNTKKNQSYYEEIKDKMIQKEETRLKDVKNLINEIKSIKISFKKEADEKDQLYGSIPKKEIIDFFQKKNLTVKSDDIIIKNQIKSIGDHLIEISPYEGISEEFIVTVYKN